MAAAASTSPPLPTLRQRLATTLNDKPHWLTLSEPSSFDANRQMLLTADANEASLVEFTGDAPTTEEPANFYVEFPEIRYTEPGLMRPRIAPTVLPTELGTVPFPGAIGKRCPLSWIKKPVTDDSSTFTLHLAEEPAQTVIISHAAGFGAKRPPELYISPEVPTEYPAAEFVLETLCTTCGFCWTEHASHVCGFCRAYAADQAYIAKHGTPPLRPCKCCGDLTPYGGYCSRACRLDAEGRDY